MLNYKFILKYIVISLIFILLMNHTREITEGMGEGTEEVVEVVEEVVEGTDDSAEGAITGNEPLSMVDSLIDMAKSIFSYFIHALKLGLLIYIAIKVSGGNVRPTPPV